MPDPISGEAGVRWRERLAVAARLVDALRGENLRLRAMGLTYLSLFALVPAMVVIFLVVRAFTGTDRIAALVHEYLIENLAVGARTSIQPYLDRFVRNAHATSAGLVGGVLLVYSAIGLFSHVERAVNEIWAIRRGRPLRQKLPIYWAGLTLGPILLAASIAMSNKALSWAGPLGPVGATVFASAFFTFLYVIIPATKVRLSSALVGGAVAGVSWQVAKAIYTSFASGFLRFHVIYGSVASFPILMTWLYVSWTILLFGARMSFVAQNAKAHVIGHPVSPTPRGRTLLAAQVMFEIALAFEEQRPPIEQSDLTTRVPNLGDQVDLALTLLRENGLVVDLVGGGLAPGRPLQSITLAEVRRLVMGPAPLVEGEAGALLTAFTVPAEDLAQGALSEVTYSALCQNWRQHKNAAQTGTESA